MKLLSSLLPIAAMAGLQFATSGSVNPATTSQLAMSFLESGDDPKFKKSAPAPVKARTPGELAAGSRSVTAGAGTPQLQPIQRLMQSDPRLESVMMNLVQNARNPQIVDMLSKYGNINFTAKGGQSVTKMTEVK